MKLIEWKADLELNIEVIDKQHKLLVDIINEIYTAYTFSNDKAELEGLINKLVVYAAVHFAREEHLFELHNYPNTDEHLKEHDYFEDTITQFEEEYIAGTQDITTDVLVFLTDWLVDHISETDRAYAPYLREKGLK